MINALFLQIQSPTDALVHSLELYFPEQEDSRTVTNRYSSIRIHSDLPDGPFLSGYMAFNDISDALIVTDNLQREIDKYLDEIGMQSSLSVQIKYHDEDSETSPDIKYKWVK